MLSLVTVSAVPEHRCFIDGYDTNSSSYVPWNSSEILAAIPLKETGELDSCHMYGENQTIVPWKHTRMRSKKQNKITSVSFKCREIVHSAGEEIDICAIKANYFVIFQQISHLE